MAKKWYPVIDYLECIECGTCVAKCTHGVYEKAKAPSPLVINPDSCIDHCHGCGDLCPQGAITYVGDDTGWQPPHGKKEDSEPCCDADSDCGCDSNCGCDSDCGCDSNCGCDSDCGCDCGCDSEETTSEEDNPLAIDFLFLDLKTCERCMGTDEILLGAINEVRSVLKTAGYSVVLNKVEIANEQLAEQYKFLSSPTIRINGQDICLDVKENSCGSCSDISSQSVDCRLFVYEGKEYVVPPKAMIINAILKAVYGKEQTPVTSEPYTLPENLKKFFYGKNNNSTGRCCGGGNCCG